MTTHLDDKSKVINSHIVTCKARAKVSSIEPVEALLLVHENGEVEVACPYLNREYSVCHAICLDNLTPCIYKR